MRVNNCPSFEGCEAPICPLDDSFEKAVWYPDELICMAKRFRREHWRIVQRKIVKVNFKNKVEGYFTLSALKEIRKVTRRIMGLNSDVRVISTRENCHLTKIPHGSTEGLQGILVTDVRDGKAKP